MRISVNRTTVRFVDFLGCFPKPYRMVVGNLAFDLLVTLCNSVVLYGLIITLRLLVLSIICCISYFYNCKYRVPLFHISTIEIQNQESR